MDNDFNYEILPHDYKEHDLAFKVVIIGNSGVGKSSLTVKAVNDQFNDFYNSTVGFEFYTYVIKIKEKIIKLQLWDTCGQETYRSLIMNFYRNSSLAILVYSIDSKKSFNDANDWLKELKSQSSPDIKVFLVGSKCDLEENRAISLEEGEKFAMENQFAYFTESSAKSGTNIQNIFIRAAKVLYDEYNKYKQESLKIGLDSNDAPKPLANQIEDSNSFSSKKGCCKM